MARMTRTFLSLALVCLVASQAAAQSAYPAPVDGDFVARGYVFASGDQIPEVKIHYRTVGTPRKDADGVVRNGVLILHGTGGTGAGFLSATYGGRLFGSRSMRRSTSSSSPTMSATASRASRAMACA
jgi:homoserine O-acetyltransferase/O-succinyltransferase